MPRDQFLFNMLGTRADVQSQELTPLADDREVIPEQPEIEPTD
jgi:hypothetical protein